MWKLSHFIIINKLICFFNEKSGKLSGFLIKQAICNIFKLKEVSFLGKKLIKKMMND